MQGHQVLVLAEGDYAAICDYPYAVRDILSHRENMRGQEDRRAVAGLSNQKTLDEAYGIRVQPYQWFVDEQNLRVMKEC